MTFFLIMVRGHSKCLTIEGYEGRACKLDDIEDDCDELDCFETLFRERRFKTMRATHDYQRYLTCVSIIRMDRLLLEGNRKSKRIRSDMKRSLSRAKRIARKHVSPEEVWYREGKGLINDDLDNL